MEKSRKEYDWEQRELFKRKNLKNLQTTGYEAFRVSPRTTTKFGKKYKKIYGATVSPDYSRKVGSKYGAKVEWFEHGYTMPSVRSGTRVLMPLKSYGVDMREVGHKLMLRNKRA
jgi:hypothetical protein